MRILVRLELFELPKIHLFPTDVLFLTDISARKVAKMARAGQIGEDFKVKIFNFLNFFLIFFY